MGASPLVQTFIVDDPWILRNPFNQLGYWEKAQSGEFQVEVKADRVPATLPPSEPPGTRSQLLYYYDLPTGEELHIHLHGPAEHMHVAIEVSDFPGAIERLRQAGTEIQGPDRRGDGSDFLFCTDPDGNRIEITYHPAWQAVRLLPRERG